MTPGSYGSRTVEALQPVCDMLNVGRCEPAKAAVHAVMMATVGVCAVYNATAWLKRRQPHLAINAVIYAAAFWWERSHVIHHLDAITPALAPCAGDEATGPVGVVPRTRDAA